MLSIDRWIVKWPDMTAITRLLTDWQCSTVLWPDIDNYHGGFNQRTLLLSAQQIMECDTNRQLVVISKNNIYSLSSVPVATTSTSITLSTLVVIPSSHIRYKFVDLVFNVKTTNNWWQDVIRHSNDNLDGLWTEILAIFRRDRERWWYDVMTSGTDHHKSAD